MQMNQSALVGEYVADHVCGFVCYLVKHVTLGNMLFSCIIITCNSAIWNSYGYISVFWNIVKFSPDKKNHFCPRTSLHSDLGL